MESKVNELQTLDKDMQRGGRGLCHQNCGQWHWETGHPASTKVQNAIGTTRACSRHGEILLVELFSDALGPVPSVGLLQ
jgi:hypothetical protein